MDEELGEDVEEERLDKDMELMELDKEELVPLQDHLSPVIWMLS